MNRLGGGHRKVEARTGLPPEKWSSVNGGIFCSLAEAKTVIESWRQHHNTRRPHSSLGDKPAMRAPRIDSGNVRHTKYSGHGLSNQMIES